FGVGRPLPSVSREQATGEDCQCDSSAPADLSQFDRPVAIIQAQTSALARCVGQSRRGTMLKLSNSKTKHQLITAIARAAANRLLNVRAESLEQRCLLAGNVNSQIWFPTTTEGAKEGIEFASDTGGTSLTAAASSTLQYAGNANFNGK